MNTNALGLWRRHTPDCAHRRKGRAWTKCSCPIWVDGERNGKRFRKSLKLTDWQRALRRLALWESTEAPDLKLVSDAVEAFLIHCRELAPPTLRKYRNIMNQFLAFCRREGIAAMAEIDINSLERYRAARPLARTTSGKELQTLRQFFAMCVRRRWITENIAKEVRMPPARPEDEPEPYTTQDVSKIIAACDQFGRGPYERLRARAMVLVLRYTGLRVSDLATLAKSRVRDGMILLRTQKTGGLVFLPVPIELQAALAQLPPPREASPDCPFFFWNGRTSRRAVVGIAERTLAAVFKKSKVPGAHAHRFRHTLATDILTQGGTLQDVGDVLGISSEVARKHYAKWTPDRQQRVLSLMRRVHSGTFLAQSQTGAVTN